MPEEGTDGHLTLLLAEYLAAAHRRHPGRPVPRRELEERTAELAREYAGHWRKDARDPAAAPALAADAIARLAALDLVTVTTDAVLGDLILPRPPLARYAAGEPQRPATGSLFAPPDDGSGRNAS
jgi:uncharacterized protein (TIGR02678 family)